MRITAVDTFLLSVREPGDDPYLEAAGARSGCLIRITTDEGLSGLGESYAGLFAPEVARAIVDLIRPSLLGRDPADINALWREIYGRSIYWGRTGIAVGVLSGIEQALWDLAGKARGVPVYKLLGGLAKDRQLIYASCQSARSSAAETVELVSTLAAGFRALKIDLGFTPRPAWLSLDTALEAERAKLQAIRSAMGPAVEVMVDAGQGFAAPPWDVKTARRVVEALDDLGLAFFEEPCSYFDFEGYAEVRRAARTPIAGGESLATRWEWERFLAAGCVDIAQPDAAWCGGIAECDRIVRMASARHVPVALHCYGLGIAVAANAHVAFANENVRYVEFPVRGRSLGDDLLIEPLVVDDGYLRPPRLPGLGVELRDETIARFPYVPDAGFQPLFQVY